MTPATVQRDPEIGILLARQPDDDLGRVIEPAVVDPEVRGVAGVCRLQHERRSRAHGFGRPEPADRRLELGPLAAARRAHERS